MGRNAQQRRVAKQTEAASEKTQDGRLVVSKATTRFVRCAPRKMKLVADQLRNQTVAEAFETLRFLHRPSAVPYVSRALKSAVANAENKTPETDALVIAEIRIEGAAMMKRIRPASMGRAVRIRKRLSHIHVKLAES